MTFFPWEHLGPARRGTGEVALTAFSVPDGSLEFWRERLSRKGVPHHEPEPRFGELALTLTDPDGLPLALVVAAEPDPRPPWTTPEIGAEHAVRGFHGVCLTLDDRAATVELLIDVMGYERARYLDMAREAPSAWAARPCQDCTSGDHRFILRATARNLFKRRPGRQGGSAQALKRRESE